MSGLPRILIVDDDFDMIETLQLFLEAQGFPVATAFSGEAAVEQARNDPPGLCVVDLLLPDMNGFEVMTRIRRLPDCEGIPVILLTAMGSIGEIQSYIGRGYEPADAYMEKPVDFERLKERIEDLLRPSSAPGPPAGDTSP